MKRVSGPLVSDWPPRTSAAAKGSPDDRNLDSVEGGLAVRAVIQRVSEAQVMVGVRTVGKIGAGALVLLGIEHADNEHDSTLVADRIIGLRIFADTAGKMNLNLKDAEGQLLVVSQFTLFADLSRGRRPSFTRAAAPEHARRLYEDFIQRCRAAGAVVEHGEFGAMMQVKLIGDGPVTIIVDSREGQATPDRGSIS